MEAIVILAGLAFAANKVVSVIKALTVGDTRTALTQVIVWVVAILGLVLTAQSSVFGAVVLPGFTVPLEDMDTPSLILIGLMTGASGSVAYDFKAAIDSSDSAREPRLGVPR